MLADEIGAINAFIETFKKPIITHKYHIILSNKAISTASFDELHKAQRYHDMVNIGNKEAPHVYSNKAIGIIKIQYEDNQAGSIQFNIEKVV